MDQLKQGSKDIAQSDRLAVLANATADAKALIHGCEHKTRNGARTDVPLDQVDRIMASGPAAARMGVQRMVRPYGPPNGGTPTRLSWFDRGPWKRIQITSDEVVYRFPTPHADFLTRYIDDEVPLDKLGELGRYDGSCLIDRTMGEAAARCDSEAANILTRNLMHDIVCGARTVEEAFSFYSETLSAYCLGEAAPYCEQFQFEVPCGSSGDPDEPVSPGPKAKQIAEKVDEFLAAAGRS